MEQNIKLYFRGRGGRKVFPITGQGGQTDQAVIGNVSNTGHGGGNVYSTDGTAPTLKARDYKGPVMVGLDKTLDNPRVIEVANCLTAREDRGLSNRKAEGTMVAIREATKKGYAIAEPGDSINLEQPNSKTRRGRVGKGVANTLTTGCQQGVLVEPKIIDDQGRVKDEYKQHDIVPCLRAQTHGNPPKVTIPVLTPDRIKKRQNGRRFKEDGEPMFTLTAQDRHGVAIMRPKRTDYGKQIRKQYEAGEVKESRHNMTTLEPVFDGVSNTITTVQKDNLLYEPKIIDALYSNRPPREYEDAAPTLRSDRHGLKVSIGLVQPKDREYKKKGGVREEHLEITKDGSAPCLRSGVNLERVVYDNGQNFRIRKLTPRECWRLQGIPDHYFDKASAVNSNSQLYKQAGNACTVNVIYEIAKRI